ncbi:MAG: lipopolysaccharide biosynthesis protein [Myxococcales bacterium]|nr:lipopolysaccharide biosynthesis protein [Myxococcales bacterium]MCB9522777.1 lipopolysaccharide biosynthesis protein [Myxococcales bacterium]
MNDLTPADRERLAALAQVSARRTVGNALFNYGGAVGTLLLGLFIQAYLVRSLGRDQYALWPVINSATAFAALVPRGVGAGVSRFLAHALGDGDTAAIERITTSVFTALAGAATLYALVILGLSVSFESVFDIPAGTEGIGPWAMLLAGLSGAVVVPAGVYRGGLMAAQQFRTINAIRVGVFAVRVGLIVLAFEVDRPHLIWVGAAFLAMGIGEAASIVITARRVLPWQRLRRAALDRETLKKVTGFSAWVLLSTVAGLLYWHTDNLIINKLMDPGLVTGYAIVASLAVNAYQFVVLGARALAPAMTIMHARGEIDRMYRAVVRANRAVLPLGLMPVLVAVVFGEEILALYVGEAYREYGPLFWLTGGAWLLCSTNQVSNAVPEAFGQMRLASVAAFVAAWVNVGLSLLFVLVFDWGLMGVAGGTFATWILYKLVFWTWLVAKMLRVPIARFVVQTALWPLAMTLPGLAVLVAARLWGLSEGLWGLMAVTAVAGVVQGVVAVTVGLDPADRAAVRRRVARLTGRGAS